MIVFEYMVFVSLRFKLSCYIKFPLPLLLLTNFCLNLKTVEEIRFSCFLYDLFLRKGRENVS